MLLKILTYSYLIFPLLLLLFKVKFKDIIVLLLALYGITFFILILKADDVPKNIKKFYNAFYTVLEYGFFTIIFWRQNKNKFFRKFVIIASALFFLFEFYYISKAAVERLDSIPIAIETILIFIYIFSFFYDFSKTVRSTFIYNHYCFWLSVGILIYLGGSFFYYMLVNNLDSKEYEKLADLTYIAETIKNILFGIAMIILQKFTVNKINNHPKNIPNLDMNVI